MKYDGINMVGGDVNMILIAYICWEWVKYDVINIVGEGVNMMI